MNYKKQKILLVALSVVFFGLTSAGAQLISDDPVYGDYTSLSFSASDFSIEHFTSFIRPYKTPASQLVTQIIKNAQVQHQGVEIELPNGEVQQDGIHNVLVMQSVTANISSGGNSSASSVQPQTMINSVKELNTADSNDFSEEPIALSIQEPSTSEESSANEDRLIPSVKETLKKMVKNLTDKRSENVNTVSSVLISDEKPKPKEADAVTVITDNLASADIQLEEVSNDEKNAVEDSEVDRDVPQVIQSVNKVSIKPATLVSPNGSVLIGDPVQVDKEEKPQDNSADATPEDQKENTISSVETDNDLLSDLQKAVEQYLQLKLKQSPALSMYKLKPLLESNQKVPIVDPAVQKAIDILKAIKQSKITGLGASGVVDTEEKLKQFINQFQITRKPVGVIIKFKSNWPYQLETSAAKLVQQSRPFQYHLADASDSIDQLNERFGVLNAKTLFMPRENISTEEAKYQWKEMMQTVVANKTKDQPQSTPPDVSSIPNLVNIYRFEFPPDSDAEEISEAYASDPHVEYAHPVRQYRTQLIPNDEFFPALWGMFNQGDSIGTSGPGVVDADIDATEAWNIELGDGVIVAVVDTGVEWDHEDLADNIWVNVDDPVDGIDNDGNGYVDDVRGWDFSTCDFAFFGFCLITKPPDNNPMDGNGHGTHVSGTIAAVRNNIGVIGVAPEATIMPVKGLNDGGSGDTEELAEALVYAAINGADVINNSWGADGPGDPTIMTAIQIAYDLGAVVVFAAGNSDLEIDPDNEAAMDQVIAVGATTNRDEKADFSNFGDAVDVSAPGQDIASTYLTTSATYAFNSGTSMAAPHVSGLAALMIAHYTSRGFSNDQIKEIMKDTTDNVGLSQMGTGRINAAKALDIDNVLPVLQHIPNVIVQPLEEVEINVLAVDPNGDTLTLTSEVQGGGALSTIGATFVDNGDGTGTFSWIPTIVQEGINPVINFTVTDSPVGLTDSQSVLIVVLLVPGCGNGVPETGEECDDGNTDNGDGCSSVCTLEEVCGNGTVGGTEECDDGNTIAGDGCSTICLNEICGNGRRDFGEKCDDNNTISGDGCSDECLIEYCGDGIINNGPDENCDDGNTDGGDGCSETCQIEACGNDIVDVGEQCDDGNLASGDGCTDMCIDEYCGDGIINDGGIEQCDDGSTAAGDGCSPVCIREECGNGIIDPGEFCDDLNLIDGDGCNSSCRPEVCGNGTCDIDKGENCGNCVMDCGYCRGLRPRSIE